MAPHLGSTPPISGNRLAEFGEDGSRRGLPVPVWLAGIDCNQEKKYSPRLPAFLHSMSYYWKGDFT